MYTFVDLATQAYLGLVGLLILLFHNSSVPNWPWLAVAHGAAIILVHLLIRAHGRKQPGRILDFLRHFYPVLLYTFMFAETGRLNRMFFSQYLDPIAIRADQGLFGQQPSLVFMQRFPQLFVSELFYAAYFSYYIMIAGVGLALYIRDRREFFHYVSVVSFVFYLCYLAYIILPVVGPPVFYKEIPGFSLTEDLQRLAPAEIYPDGVRRGIFFQIMALIYQFFEAPGAAFPSSHVAIAAVTVYFSFRYLRRIRYLHLVIAFLLCLSTVYCHYHYVVDVLAGVLTAGILVPLCNWLFVRFGQAQPPNGELAERPSQRRKVEVVNKT